MSNHKNSKHVLVCDIINKYNMKSDMRNSITATCYIKKIIILVFLSVFAPKIFFHLISHPIRQIHYRNFRCLEIDYPLSIAASFIHATSCWLSFTSSYHFVVGWDYAWYRHFWKKKSWPPVFLINGLWHYAGFGKMKNVTWRCNSFRGTLIKPHTRTHV